MIAPRFWAERLPSGVILTRDLPLDEWEWSQTLNRAGALTAKIPLAADISNPTMQGPHSLLLEQFFGRLLLEQGGTLALEQHDPTLVPQVDSILDPWRTAIYVVEGTQVRWGGILTPPSLGAGEQSLNISCFEWPGWFDRNDIFTDRQFTNTEQFTIFRTLVRDLQDLDPDFDLDIDVVWDAPSGVLRDRLDAYRVFQSKNLGEALRQLAAVRDGFDFAMRYTINPATDRIDKTIQLYYPRKGRETLDTFEYERGQPTNIIEHGFADPVELAWYGTGWGEGADAARRSSAYVDADLLGVYPVFSASPQFSSTSTQATLDANTEGFFERRRRPRRTVTTRVNPDAHPRWGTYELGDILRVRIDDGLASSDARRRLIGWQVSHDSSPVLEWGDTLGDDPAEDEVF